ncbi:MAG: hypothetical protein KIT36_23385 [Alphaproteobacteria bacterium]|nr:hypothetical protein [Alphaproteobacteria bacterium]
MATRRTATNDDFAAEVAALKKQLSQLAESIESSAKTEGPDAMRAIGERARDFLATATAFVEGMGRDVGQVAGQSAYAAASRVKSVAGDGTERLEAAIRERPLTAVAVALGLGCVASMLLRRH